MKEAIREPHRLFFTSVFLVLIIQFLTRYITPPYDLENGFRWLHALIQWGIPFLFFYIFKLGTYKDLFLGLPKVSHKQWILLLSALMIVPFLVPLMTESENALKYYQGLRNSPLDRAERLLKFLYFTISTVPGWEFIHRGFLVGTLLIALKKINEDLKISIIISIITIFEVVFHFTKPELEPLGMMVFSPAMTWLAIKSKSIWIPMILHLWIEGWFMKVMIQ